jgi:hypothetical protein
MNERRKTVCLYLEYRPAGYYRYGPAATALATFRLTSTTAVLIDPAPIITQCGQGTIYMSRPLVFTRHNGLPRPRRAIGWFLRDGEAKHIALSKETSDE